MSDLKNVSVAGDFADAQNTPKTKTQICNGSQVRAKGNFSSLTASRESGSHIREYEMQNKGPLIGKRHIQAGLICLSLTIGFAMRTCLSLAIVAMTDKNSSPNPNIPTYDWKNTSVILSSFFWGYVCLQVIAGYFANAYGPKYFLLPAFAINSIAFLLIPYAADRLGSIGVIVCRIVQGLSQGFLYPSAHSVLGKWAPIEERATMGSIVYSGASLGTILASIATGYLSSSWAGWPASFYIIGSLGLAWCILYFFLAYNSPAVHPTITKEERYFIEDSLEEGETETEHIPVPWKLILTSLPVYAILVANISGAWGYAMTMTEIPTYLAKVMKLEIGSNGVASAIPYMVSMALGYIFAIFADYIVRNGYISRINTRRSFQLFAAYGQLMCLLLLTYAAKTQAGAISLLAIGNGFNAAIIAGYSINHVDISPRFCGILQGICNGSSQAIALFAPLLVHYTVKNQENAIEWRVIFLVTATLYFIGATLFALFASASRQKWDGPKTENPEIVDRLRKSSIISLPNY